MNVALTQPRTERRRAKNLRLQYTCCLCLWIYFTYLFIQLRCLRIVQKSKTEVPVSNLLMYNNYLMNLHYL